MNSVRILCVLCLALAVASTFAGRVGPLEVADVTESDPSVSLWDDGFATLCAVVTDAPAHAPVSPLPLKFEPPSDRLIVSDLFRPPDSAPF